MIFDSAEDNLMQTGFNSVDDSLLLDDLNSHRGDTPKKKQTQVLEKLKNVENLLMTNLESLSSQKKFYDKELETKNEQINQLKQSVEAMNTQVTRDKMKIKLREDKIAKLETEHQIEPDEAQKLLKAEIDLLTQQLD